MQRVKLLFASLCKLALLGSVVAVVAHFVRELTAFLSSFCLDTKRSKKVKATDYLKALLYGKLPEMQLIPVSAY